MALITNARLLEILQQLPQDAVVQDPHEELNTDIVFHHPDLNVIQIGSSQAIPAILAPGWRVYDLRDPNVKVLK